MGPEARSRSTEGTDLLKRLKRSLAVDERHPFFIDAGAFKVS